MTKPVTHFSVILTLRNKGDSQFTGDPYALLETWRSAVLQHNEQAILIGEADVEPEA
ncbi:hypothetical protein [Parapedobacter koreensis]|uniref:Maltose alpha-D-glucosyltransferase/ alpha-amylase n=1 Tax=Parapedobacter koreensis TaxID=332977 RepID=A0A1H7T1K3_9SPHI|nr:hypothetical protein [Parapedobacter koreensis]SEL78812.1 maltose alpha-D-glucosyltransferase/ alpha-amylase [Parapedobacter koreensis]